MTIATYSELVTELEAYLKRTDYTARIPTFIALAEAKLNRLLDDPAMDVVATFATATIVLPSDFKRAVSVSSDNGTALVYSVIGANMFIGPDTFSGSGTLVYSRRLPALTAGAPTNWLLTRAPDIYLWGTLMQANIFGWDDERVPGFQSLFDEAIGDMRHESQNRRWGGSPLAPRIMRT